MKFKHWLLTTLGLFVVAMVFVIVSDGNNEGILYTLFSIVCIGMLVSGFMTILSAIISIFKLLCKIFTKSLKNDSKESDIKSYDDSVNFKQQKIFNSENLEKQTTLNNLHHNNAVERGVINLYKAQIDSNTLESLNKRYISFDVETTGLSPQRDRIIEVGAVLFENGMASKKFNTLVNPGVSISKSTTAVNHITNEMIKDAPDEEVVYKDLIEFFGDSLSQQTIICAHNASFDMNFLSETLMRLGYSGDIKYVDTLQLSRRFVKGLDSYKQDIVAEHFGFVNEQSHRAVSDAEICGKILDELLMILNKENEREQEQRQKILETNKLNDNEREICAYFQYTIIKNGGDSKWLCFIKNSNNYVGICYLYTILKFKCSKKRKLFNC